MIIHLKKGGRAYIMQMYIQLYQVMPLACKFTKCKLPIMHDKALLKLKSSC